jgi:pyruvate ferredoxin oxidoreductase alpha subunit
MPKYDFLNGNEAVAYGVKLSRPHVVSAYPITPQTKAVEKIAQFVQDGDLECEYMHVESEHSAMSCAIGSSSVGARTFTATSSQGLLYMLEGLPYASGARLPIVMMNANRSIATPWNIYGDQMDAMFALPTGWIQIFVEDAQEALDMMIQSFKLAEDHEILTPVMVNMDGFVLSHTYEKVQIPEQKDVDDFLPEIVTAPHLMQDENPMSMCISAGNKHNMEFKIKQHKEMEKAFEKFEKIDLEFEKKFGRGYGSAIVGYCHEDAECLLVTAGSVTGTAKNVVDKLRKAGKKVGLLKLRMIRPFPIKLLKELCSNNSTIGVLDKNISCGYEGSLFTNINSALKQNNHIGETYNFIGGIGGRDITPENIEEMFDVLLGNKKAEKISFYNMRCEL